MDAANSLISDADTSGLTEHKEFETRSLAVLTRLRNAVDQAFAGIPGGIQKSHDVQKLFGQSFAVSWQIYRMLRADQPMEISSHVPTPKPMKKLLAAMSKKGISAQAVSSVETAYEEFLRLVAETSGDRAAFEAMTTRAIGGVTDAEVESNRRKDIFDSYRYLLGLEQDLYVGTTILYPSESGLDRFDMVSIRFRKNLRRLRSDVSLKIDSSLVTGHGGTPLVRLPLDEEAYQKHGLYILPEFCSRREIPLERSELANGYMITKWRADGVGQSSAIDLAIGGIHRGMQWGRTERGMFSQNLLTPIRTPTRRFVEDVIIHKSAFGKADFTVTQWFATDAIDPSVRLEETGELNIPCNGRLTLMPGLEGGALAEFPNYVQMIRQYCQKFGWKPDDMLLYRTRSEYPILHTMQRIEVVVPEVKSM